MARFSIGEAYGEGFRLIARKPLPVLVWGLVYFILRGLPFALMMLLFGPHIVDVYADFIASAMRGDSEPDMQRLVELSTQMQLISLLDMVLPVVAAAIINAAIYRAVLRPEDGGFLHMKLGMDEVWQGLLFVCVLILFFILAFVVALGAAALIAAVFFIGEGMGSPGGGWIKGLGITAIVVAAIVGLIWVGLRFSMAGPATFDNRTFQLFESWTLTKGQAWPLFGLALLLAITLLAIQLVLSAAFLAAFLAAGSIEALSPEAMEAFFAQPVETWLAQATPWMIGVTLISALLTGALYVIWSAPWARAYSQLAARLRPAADAPLPEGEI